MAATDIERGLSTAEVEERIAAGKINRNMELKTKSVKELIIENLCTLFNLINVVLAVLVLLTGSFKNLTFLFVVFLNTAIGRLCSTISFAWGAVIRFPSTPWWCRARRSSTRAC